MTTIFINIIKRDYVSSFIFCCVLIWMFYFKFVIFDKTIKYSIQNHFTQKFTPTTSEVNFPSLPYSPVTKKNLIIVTITFYIFTTKTQLPLKGKIWDIHFSKFHNKIWLPLNVNQINDYLWCDTTFNCHSRIFFLFCFSI